MTTATQERTTDMGYPAKFIEDMTLEQARDEIRLQRAENRRMKELLAEERSVKNQAIDVLRRVS
jgi:hypothetical protein